MRLKFEGKRVDLIPADSSDPEGMHAMLCEATRYSVLDGLLHAASTFGADMIAKMAPSTIPFLYSAKATGASLWHHGTNHQPLRLALFYSSLAAVAPSYTYNGQAHYAAANTYVDSLTQMRSVQALRARAIQMANVAEQGMGAMISDAAARMPGIVRITLEQYAGCIATSLFVKSAPPLAAILPGDAKEVLREFQGATTIGVNEIDVTMSNVDGRNSLRFLTPWQRVAMSKAAEVALDAVVRGKDAVPVPQSDDILVVGCGLAGLIVSCALLADGQSVTVIEKSASVGGVWRSQGNPHSRVNSSEPGYRVQVQRSTLNTNHSTHSEICLLYTSPSPRDS